MNTTTIEIIPEQITRHETTLVKSGVLSASLFRFPSGVQAVRLVNDVGHLVMLPFQGQQIWEAVMHGRNLTMRTIFDQPYPNRDLLSSFGCFMMHCGATTIGSPGPKDNHPVHGELPDATYEDAQVLVGEDEHGTYIGLTGTYRHQKTFNYNYVARPLVKLYQGSSIFHIEMTVTNLRPVPLPMMYLAHINFRCVENGRIYYSTPIDPQHVMVRSSVPSHMVVKPTYRDFIERLKVHPEDHLVLKPELDFDPEIVFYINYLADDAGWARAMQVHPDGSADIVLHRTDQLNKGLCWISRIGDQQAIGLEPGTAEVEGYTIEKEKGNLRYIESGQSFHCDIRSGYLSAQEAAVQRKILEDTAARG
jgi:hypothetical protein